MKSDYRQTIERTPDGWRILGDPETYPTLQEAWDEARQDLLQVGGGRIEVVDTRGRVRARHTVLVQDLGHAR
jgi:hypothetical protein